MQDQGAGYPTLWATLVKQGAGEGPPNENEWEGDVLRRLPHWALSLCCSHNARICGRRGMGYMLRRFGLSRGLRMQVGERACVLF